MSEQPGTFGTDTDAQQIVTEVLVLDGEEIETLVGLAFDSIDGDGLEFVGDWGQFEGEVTLVDGGEEIEIVGAEWHSDGEKEVVEWHRGPRGSHFDIELLETDVELAEAQFDVQLLETDVEPGPAQFDVQLLETDVEGAAEFDVQLLETKTAS